MQEQNLGTTHSSTLATVTALARAMIRSENYPDALKYFRRVLGAQENALGYLGINVWLMIENV